MSRFSGLLSLLFPTYERPSSRDESATQFQEEVFATEIEYARDRWKAAGIEHPGVPEGTRPSTHHQLVGLAFSGGGIRSATFNLGVLQALYRRGVFRFVDYLSTVSGGGFLGSSLSTLLSQHARERRQSAGGETSKGGFPFEFRETEREAPAVTYLRNNSNYLTPRGLVDYLRLFAVLVRGIILNFFVLLPLLLLGAMGVTLVYGEDLLARLREDDSRRRVDELLDRNWTGMEAEGSVSALLDALEGEAMLDRRRGMNRARIVQWLRGEVATDEPLDALISGSGKQYADYRFRAGVTRKRVVRRLWESGALHPLGVLEEVDEVERALRASAVFREDFEDAGEGFVVGVVPVGSATMSKSLEELYSALSGVFHDPEAVRSGREKLGRVLAPHQGTPLLATWASRQRFLAALSDAGLLEGSRLASDATLRQVLQELYQRGLYRPKWFGERMQSRVGWQLSYREPWELATLESAVLEADSELPRSTETGAVSGLAAPRFRVGQLQRLLLEMKLDPDVEDSPSALVPERRVKSVALPPLELLHVDSLPELLRLFYDAGILSLEWLEGTLDKQPRDERWPGPVAYVENYLAYDQPAVEVPQPWDPYRLQLPFTFRLMVFALAWVVLYPFVLSLRRLAASVSRGSKTAIGCLVLGVLAITLLAAIALVISPLWSVAVLAVLAALVALLRWLPQLRRALWWRDVYERSFSLLLILIALVAFIELQPYLIYHYRQLRTASLTLSLSIGAISLLVSAIAGPALAYFNKVGRNIVLLMVALLGPILPLMLYVELVIQVVYRRTELESNDLLVTVSFFGVLALIVHLLNLPLDVNSTSLHGFYRDRLSQAYLLRGEGDDIAPADDVKLEEISQPGSGAPYHLINVTLNLQGARDPSLRRRRGDFFVFSRSYIGGNRTGYCRTEDMRDRFPFLYLSSAMAVSAAAAAPNMGTFTFRPLVILMALLNIRLGFWLPNPMRINRWLSEEGSWLRRAGRRLRLFMASLVGSFRARPGAYLLLREMLSQMHGDSRLVNLSDGGHMENTGVFELLRRRCRFIIVGDAEADPDLRFGGLAALIRYARIDLGIEIQIHVDDLRLDSEGESRQHCALGLVRYPPVGDEPAEVGYLLYIKASLTGDESEIVSEYGKRSPLFPHESTADQSFNEGQFEAYRDLGFHIADGLFQELGIEEVKSFDECAAWFEILATMLSPGISAKVPFADIQNELGSVERMLREKEYNDYFYELYPDLAPPGYQRRQRDPEEEAQAFRRVFHLVNIQLQLMESLFSSLELNQKANREHPANRGWMNLFRRWARAPSFRRAYLPSITTYSAPFQQFCESALGLKMKLTWEHLTEARRRVLAADATEIGLSSLKRPVGGMHVRLLFVSIGDIEPIPIGEAYLRPQGDHYRVSRFSLRAGYQGSSMRARALMSLRRWAGEAQRELSLGTEAIALRSTEFITTGELKVVYDEEGSEDEGGDGATGKDGGAKG